MQVQTERTHSLDSPLPNMELTLGDTIPSPDAPTDSTFAEGRLQDLLNGALDKRTPRHWPRSARLRASRASALDKS